MCYRHALQLQLIRIVIDEAKLKCASNIVECIHQLWRCTKKFDVARPLTDELYAELMNDSDDNNRHAANVELYICRAEILMEQGRR